MARPASPRPLKIEVFAADAYVGAVVRKIHEAWPSSGAVVITGGTTAEKVYRELELDHALDVFFSDERCVPPDDDASNFRMANDLFLARSPARVHRMRGELDPEQGAREYHQEIAPFVTGGLELMLLGMGADCHIGAMFPGSPALAEARSYCRAVDRPDGMKGLTLTPPAMGAAKEILLLVTGASKADAVRRAIEGTEAPSECPARSIAEHERLTFLLDNAAASGLGKTTEGGTAGS